MNRIDVLAFKMYSYDTDAFVEDILRYSRNSILLVHYFDKIVTQYKPPGVKLKANIINYINIRNQSMNYYFSPVVFLINIFLKCKLFLLICWKYQPKVCWMEDIYSALFIGLLRKFHLCKKSIYIPGDWVITSVSNKKLWSRIANNLCFPILDYLCCKLNDIVVNHVEKIEQARYEYWGRRIAKKEKLYSYKLQIRADDSNLDNKKNGICFIGNMREDSGLDIAIRSLVELRKRNDFIIKIIGPEGKYCEHLKKIPSIYNIEKYIEFLGFVETDKFGEILSECFCGINLITDINSYSYNTIPGKLIHYLQYLLPVIVTEGVGPFTACIQENGLGVVIEPSQDSFIEAVSTIYINQNQYRENIVRYINSMPEFDIKEIIECQN